MPSASRRDFLKSFGLLSSGVVIGGPALLASCSTGSDKKSFDSSKMAALIVSSDLYKSSLPQRFAFSIFEEQNVISDGTIPVTLTSPTGKRQSFESVSVRETGIKGNGIYSIQPILDEEGIWDLETTFANNTLTLKAQVFATSKAPSIGSTCPTAVTPTASNPLDATVLCTRFQGDCGLHTHSVDTLLATGKPFAVMFATPARCQTTYCGPVLELARELDADIPIIHIEIYKNETSHDVLDAVEAWGLESEPWLFGVSGEGKITERLDGAFDQSEIKELLTRLG